MVARGLKWGTVSLSGGSTEEPHGAQTVLSCSCSDEI